MNKAEQALKLLVLADRNETVAVMREIESMRIDGAAPSTRIVAYESYGEWTTWVEVMGVRVVMPTDKNDVDANGIVGWSVLR